MTNATVPGNTKKKRRGLLWKVPLGGLVLLLLMFAVFRLVVHQRVQNRLNAIRAAGYPVTMTELDVWYPEPEGTNAAEVYAQAFEALVEDQEAERELPILGAGAGLPEPGIQLEVGLASKIEAYLDRNSEALRLLEKAVLIPDCRYMTDVDKGDLDTVLPHLGGLRRSGRLLKLKSILEADSGDYESAAKTCLNITALARSLGREPLLISTLVNISINRLAHGQIERLISAGKLSDESLLSIDEGIVMHNVIDDNILHAFVGERVIGNLRFQSYCGSLEAWRDMTAWHKAKVYARRITGIEDLDQAYWLDCWPITIGYAANPTWPPHDESWYPGPPPDFYTESHCQCDTFADSIFRTMWEYRASVTVLKVAVAVGRYRLHHDRLPARLEDLVSEYLDQTPIDPFDDAPLRYRLQGDGAIIYSIGRDGVDDQGKQFAEDGNEFVEGTDIPFTFGGLQEKLWPREAEIGSDHE